MKRTITLAALIALFTILPAKPAYGSQFPHCPHDRFGKTERLKESIFDLIAHSSSEASQGGACEQKNSHNAYKPIGYVYILWYDQRHKITSKQRPEAHMAQDNKTPSVTGTAKRIWKSAQLYIGFHRDPQGRKRDVAKIWPPKNANATIHEDPSEQEAFVVLKSENSSSFGDMQVKFRSDKVILRRDTDTAWQGIQADAMGVIVQMADGVRIKVWHDGSVTRATDRDYTTIELDSSVFKKTKYTAAYMSGDGSEVETSTPTHSAEITEDGVRSSLDFWPPE